MAQDPATRHFILRVYRRDNFTIQHAPPEIIHSEEAVLQSAAEWAQVSEVARISVNRVCGACGNEEPWFAFQWLRP